uniref:NAD(P)-binding domain-containing protein n=2 Tax=Calcidiscus leptoporus TaxID=127549 RepID=A0A7S0JJC4_9EUKA|mmetsp:Transcript_7043/g.16474  ORF Transcript_7043/g.16474 Transcript_7043/m.16474 type:complete len:409 (+) Transcript_7043:42-1268(+)
MASSSRVGALFVGACALFALIGWKYGGSGASADIYVSADSHSHIRRTLQAAAAAAKGKRVVLLTGAAGFVGFHTAMKLHANGEVVLGVDNFNAYYQVSLKRSRASILKKAHSSATPLHLFEGDVCDDALLKLLLREGHVTNVIHLAAQAGVRYSLKKPLAYVEANIKCFVTLLEAVNSVNSSIPITYASSSSVYGINKKIPFQESDRIDSQASLYGATKKANENIAHVYHHLHGLRLTGLRFFTVYGPYGRPDMAYFSFTQAILAGQQIVEYRKDDGTELQRDFTYVSDIVNGIIAAMHLGAPLEVFNLGNTRPERVSRLISLLERGLGRHANKTLAPISAGDVPITYADVSHATEQLGYEPKVSLEHGIRQFLQWYSSYYNIPLPAATKNRRGLRPRSDRAWLRSAR